MGLDDILKSATSGEGNSQGGGLMDSIMGLIGGNNNGLGGLVEKFTAGGLGDVVSSWVGIGENKPVSADQISSVLGDGKIAEIASKAGLDPKTTSSKLSEILPQIVDKLTPNGKIDADNLSGFDLSSLTGLFK